MILTAFDVKFHEKKDEIPPGACKPLKKLKKNNVEKVDLQKMIKQNNVDKEGPPPARPPVRPPARAGGPGGGSPLGNIPVCSLNITVNSMGIV